MKKALPAAIALAGSLGFAAAANAVNVNSDGLGQVLLYSYYSVNDGNDTYVSVTNTSDRVVAAKVRFVESMNSQEVLDFNLYLSPYDVWVGTVSADGTGAKLTTDDTSCTVPAIPAAGVAFRNFQYVGTTYNTGRGGPQGLDRTRTGHLEVIQMGEVEDTLSPSTAFTPEAWATHVAGKPANCAGLVKAWSAGGTWATDKTVAIVPQMVTSALYGAAVIIDVDAGTELSYDPVALDKFSADQNHAAPGNIEPNLNNADPEFTLPGDATVYTPSSLRGVDAVSAVLQKAQIYNDYVTVSELDATTDWVVTFPTKNFYTTWAAYPQNGSVNWSATNPEPFTNVWTSAATSNGVPGTACESIGITYYDREELGTTPPDLDFSPQPPGQPGFALCWEANVIGINGSSVLGGGYNHSNLDLEHDKGWMTFNFQGSRTVNWVDPQGNPGQVVYDREISTSNGYDIQGLPAIGFSASQLVNGDVGGLLSNYGGSFNHKANVVVVD